jgi:plasmid stabilization system protein ParE
MRGYVLHPAAIDDLNDIWEYIAADSLDAGDRVLEEISTGPFSLSFLFPPRPQAP